MNTKYTFKAEANFAFFAFLFSISIDCRNKAFCICTRIIVDYKNNVYSAFRKTIETA